MYDKKWNKTQTKTNKQTKNPTYLNAMETVIWQ